MTFETCSRHLKTLEDLATGEGKDCASVAEPASEAMDRLAETFYTTIRELGIPPRKLNDMRERLNDMEDQFRSRYLSADEVKTLEEHYCALLADFYLHYNDIMGTIQSAMGTRGLEYDEPHVITHKGFVPLGKPSKGKK